MIDMIRVGKTRNLLRAPSSLLEIWPRSAHHHPGQRRQSAAFTGLTKVRTRSHVQTFRKSLQTERHPQKKILAIGNACAKDLLPVKARLADRALRDEIARMALPQNPSIADVTALLERIDPHCQWTWGESALRAWIAQFLARPTTAGSSASQAVLAYCHGLGFRDDLSHSYQQRLQATSPVEFELAVRDIFLNDFEVSPA